MLIGGTVTAPVAVQVAIRQLGAKIALGRVAGRMGWTPGTRTEAAGDTCVKMTTKMKTASARAMKMKTCGRGKGAEVPELLRPAVAGAAPVPDRS